MPDRKEKYLLDNLKLGLALPDRLRQKFKDLVIEKHQAFGAHRSST